MMQATDAEVAIQRAYTALSVSLSSGQEPPAYYTVAVGRDVFKIEVLRTSPNPHATEYTLGPARLASHIEMET